MALVNPQLGPMHVLAVELQPPGRRVRDVIALGIVDDVDAFLRPEQCPGLPRLLVGRPKLRTLDIPPCHGSPADAAGLRGGSERRAGCDQAADPGREFGSVSGWPTRTSLRCFGSLCCSIADTAGHR